MGELSKFEMENIAPPPSEIGRDVPTKGIVDDVPDPQILALGAPLQVVASHYRDLCNGEDRYDNNCAHYLSNAFISAGYSELLPPNEHINARCATSAKRPIRARELWNWFKSMATETSRDAERNSGWWAAFQLNEERYWGGHVVILDTDSWTYFGTGVYYSWDQYLYRW